MEINDLIENADSLLKIAMNKCRDINAAEDLVQETLLAALVNISKGKAIENINAWLVTILNNKYYDWLRKKYNKPVISYDESPMIIADDSDSFEDIINKESFEEIRKEVAYLSKTYREVMVRYYMKDESVAEIAEAIKIPIGTVKSRLDSGRKEIKKGVDNMENYAKQSYEPDILYVSCSGGAGLNNEPFSLVKNDKIAENILILAYEKPITEVQISKILGIPTAYIEPIVNKLVDGELIKRMPSGKIYTDFIIFTEKDRTATLDKQKEIVLKYFNLFWTPMVEGIKELREQEFYLKQSDNNRKKLENHFCIHTLIYGTIRVRDEITGIMPYSEYPYRKNGGRWFAHGNKYSANYDYTNTTYFKYGISGEARTEKENYQNVKYICLAQYDSILGKTPVGEVAMNMEKTLELLFSIYKGENSEVSPVDAFYFNEIPTFEKLGIVTRTNGKVSIDLPVLTSAEYRKFKKLSSKHLEMVYKSIRDILIGLFEEEAVRLPEHLTSVPKWQRYVYCGNFIPMMVILEAVKKGLFQNDKTNPAMILIVDE